MTERMYYDDPYTLEFKADITEMTEIDGLYHIYLDKSYFYPTSGGQPFDKGTIGGAEITDVFVDKNGDVCHVTNDKPDTTVQVFCAIDGGRRRDHMQQHAGEHMIAGAIYRLFGGSTIGLHLGETDSTIDVTMPDGRTRISPEEILMVEDEVNSEIQKDVPIKCWFTDEEELKTLPLRKPPTVTEHVRIVRIGDKEYCACGGTHPKSAGEIALVKITDVRPSKGKMRVTFVCGMRAVRLLQSAYAVVTAAGEMLTTNSASIVHSIENLIAENKQLRVEAGKLRLAAAMEKAGELWNDAVMSGGRKYVIHAFEGLEIEEMRAISEKLFTFGECTAVFASDNGGSHPLMLSENNGCGTDFGKLIRACGGKGGGKNGYAQGSCESAAEFIEKIKAQLIDPEEQR